MVGGGWRGGNGRSAGATAGHCHGLDVDAHSPGEGMRKWGFSRGERVVRAEPPRIKLVPSRETPEITVGRRPVVNRDTDPHRVCGLDLPASGRVTEAGRLRRPVCGGASRQADGR